MTLYLLNLYNMKPSTLTKERADHLRKERGNTATMPGTYEDYEALLDFLDTLIAMNPDLNIPNSKL
jgi:hypothetical protein